MRLWRRWMEESSLDLRVMLLETELCDFSPQPDIWGWVPISELQKEENGIFSCVHRYIHFNLRVYLLYKQQHECSRAWKLTVFNLYLEHIYFLFLCILNALDWTIIVIPCPNVTGNAWLNIYFRLKWNGNCVQLEISTVTKDRSQKSYYFLSPTISQRWAL